MYMREIEVSAERKYSVFIGVHWQEELKRLASGRRKVGIVVSTQMVASILSLELPDCELHILKISDGEAGKSSAMLVDLWSRLGAAGFSRSDLIIGIGGGAVTDVTGFVASSWLRGIDWIAVPTTVAGMVDAAVGGKTGINTEHGKNLVGAFYSPVAVLEDFAWLSTLSDRDFSAGLAEVIKCGFIADENILDLVSRHSLAQIRGDVALTQSLIEAAVAVKAHVVSEDFKEGSLREILNYGHTFGHAIEIHSKYQMRHGEAVSIGMVFIAEIAHQRGLISFDSLMRHREILRSVGLPITLPQSFSRIDITSLTQSMQRDKKAKEGKARFVCLQDGGQIIRLDDVNSDEISTAYEKLLS